MPKPKDPTMPADEPVPVHQLLGRKLRATRLSKGFKSSESFSLHININRTQYARYEKGRGDIQFSTLVKIVEGLGISLKEFFEEGFEGNVASGDQK